MFSIVQTLINAVVFSETMLLSPTDIQNNKVLIVLKLKFAFLKCKQLPSSPGQTNM